MAHEYEPFENAMRRGRAKKILNGTIQHALGFEPPLVCHCSLAGWLSEHQQRSIEYLMEENRILREQFGDTKLRFTDDQRRRLAFRAKELSRSVLNKVATIVTPETLLAWHRMLIAKRPQFAVPHINRR
jgi:hypothetical protein